MITYALIVRRQHPYRDNSEKVKQDLTKAPVVHVLETLHNIGRQLTALRLVYQSYATVVTRLLTRYQSMLPAAAASSWHQATNRDYGINGSQNFSIFARVLIGVETRCILYLPDTSAVHDEFQELEEDKETGRVTKARVGCFECRDWFTRCWTSPELLAPTMKYVFDRYWRFLVTKETSSARLQRVTNIEAKYLNEAVSQACIAVKMS